MSQNFKKAGDTIKWTNTTGSLVKSGFPVNLPHGKVCVASGDIADTETGILFTEGVFEWPKTNPLVIAQGDVVYWDGVKVTKTVTDNVLGTCHEAAASTDTTVLIDIDDAAGGTQMAFIAQIATVDASDLPTAIALANATKAKVNAILTSLITSGRMAGD